jgi:hypothetical protein
MRSSRTRRGILGLAALVFLGIAVASLYAPRDMARALGYTLDNVDAMSEFRAVYVGLWTATALLLLLAVVRIDQAILGDLGALLILGQVGGRIVSLALDGVPTVKIWPMFLLELAGGLAIVAIRPGQPKPPAPPPSAAAGDVR